jgi:prepilin-type processing-associated H-X9-DG protein
MALGAGGCVIGVVLLIGMVLARANETGKRQTCANHERVIGKAVRLYHEHSGGVYPQAVVETPRALESFAPWLGEPYSRRLGWMVAVLSFVELPARSEAIDPRILGRIQPVQSWDAPVNRELADLTVRVFLCPSHPDFDPTRRPAVSHYFGSAGLGTDAAELPEGAARAGLFGYERRLLSGEGLPDPIPRGQSYTLMAAETILDNGPWTAAGTSTVRGIDPARRPYLGHNRQIGGLHPGGANLLLVDGSVRFYTDGTSPEIIEAMLTLGEP